MKEITYDFHSRFNTKGIKPSQNLNELRRWLEWMQKEFQLDKWNNRGRKFKYLEIGSYAGESLYYVSQVLPRGSTIVLVDLGDNITARSNLYNIIDYCVKEYNHYIPLVSGNSTDSNVVNKVKDIEEQYDVCFIDGNHTFDYAASDYSNYGPLSSRICFHDISSNNVARSKEKYPPFGQALVGHLWESLKLGVKETTGISESFTDKETGEFVTRPLTITNWLEIVDTIDAKGFGIIYGGKFG